jgi:hypothetical protein
MRNLFVGVYFWKAPKVAVSIFLAEKHEPDFLERWFSDGELDVRSDPAMSRSWRSSRLTLLVLPWLPTGSSAAPTRKALTILTEPPVCGVRTGLAATASRTSAFSERGVARLVILLASAKRRAPVEVRTGGGTGTLGMEQLSELCISGRGQGED